MDTSILPAQSSSALPLPPQPRLELLPTELLQEIIEHLVPTYYNVGSWHERRAILRPLCLTSKRLLQVTQPVLARALWLRNEPDWSGKKGEDDDISLGCKTEEHWGNCRWLRLVVYKLTPNVEAALQRVAAAASKLDDVACSGTIFTVDRFMHHSEFVPSPRFRFARLTGIDSQTSRNCTSVTSPCHRTSPLTVRVSNKSAYPTSVSGAKQIQFTTFPHCAIYSFRPLSETMSRPDSSLVSYHNSSQYRWNSIRSLTPNRSSRNPPTYKSFIHAISS